MSWGVKPLQLLVLVSCFSGKSQFMLWNTGEYYQKKKKGLLPKIQKLFSIVERSNVIFHHDKAPAHTAKTTKKWLRTSPSGSLFGLVRFEPYREYLVSH